MGRCQVKFRYNDGGRAAAGFKGTTGDCGVRALAIAAQMPYKKAYDLVNANARYAPRKGKRKGRRTSARGGVWRQDFRRIMARLGWTWTPTMGVGTGCIVHLNASELPKGRIIVSLSRHYAAVIDGALHDSFDSSERGTTIYPLSTPKEELPKKATLHPDGDSWIYSPERCVYGYWSKET